MLPVDRQAVLASSGPTAPMKVVEIDVSEDQRQPAQLADTDVALRCFRLTLAYDGSRYFGWQRQPDHPTVQAAVEAALGEMTGEEKVSALASSRTDTGVHAVGQSVVFTTARWPAAAERIPFALNTKLPPDIVARQAVEVPVGFNPLRESTGKRYRYIVYSSRNSDPLNVRMQWWVRRRMNIDKMREAAACIVGRHDFACFQSTGSPRESTVRDVRELSITSQPHMDGVRFSFEIEASGFLYNMVRNIVGTLVQVGVGKEPPGWVRETIDSKDRRLAGPTAPPQGLCLLEVRY